MKYNTGLKNQDGMYIYMEDAWPWDYKKTELDDKFKRWFEVGDANQGNEKNKGE